MLQDLKQGLLHHGGYRAARELYRIYQDRQVTRRIETFQRTGKLPLPDMVMLEPTQRCNSRCRMCYQDRSALARTPELPWQRYAKFIEDNPRLSKVTIIGGEPFVRRDTMDLIEWLDRSRTVVVCTNGTLLGEDQLARLSRCSRIIAVCVSLEGPEELHDEIRGLPGSYEKAVNTIRALAPHIPVTVNCVIQDATIEVLPDLVRICASLGARKLKLELERLYHDSVREDAQNLAGLSATEVPLAASGTGRSYSADALRSTIAECRRRGRSYGITVCPDPPYLERDIEACWTDDVRRDYRGSVCAAFRTVTITPDGQVVHCHNVRRPFGSIVEQTLEEIWNGEEANGFRRHLLECGMLPVCENCPFFIPRAGNHRRAS
jgi:radical SAM protein with 4Fe4S-binding SPASM domain